MTYDYYCVDCGNKLASDEINFDLADLLGIRVRSFDSSKSGDKGSSKLEKDEKGDFKKFVKRKTTQISAAKLMELADKRNIKLRHHTRTFMKVTLKDFLMLMGENEGGAVFAGEMRRTKYSDLQLALERLFSTRENREVAEKLIKEWKDALEARFQLSEDAAETITQELNQFVILPAEVAETHRVMQENTSNYVAGFWIEPEFFEDGQSSIIDTIRYSYDAASANYEDIHEPMTIRGYCPRCGQPVVEGAGRYPHELVGLLGAQSSGKTSMIMSMVRELQRDFENLGISYPGAPLCDSRYQIMMLNKELYDKGWAVEKTNASSNEGTFNVTLRISDVQGRKTKLVTFVDIAGEQCYDIKNQQVNQSAFTTYPVIDKCSLYLLCSCIDRTGYGNAEGEKKEIPENALLDIAQEIYNRCESKSKIPPLCLVMTKADMSPAPGNHPSATNPFKNIVPPPGYCFQNQINNLARVYDMTDNRNVREPLEWCGKTFNQISRHTYVSMMSCSALGRSGARYNGDIQDIPHFMKDGKECGFRSVRIDVLCKWIMEVLGLKVLDNVQFILPFVPSYREYYSIGTSVSGWENYFPVTETAMRYRIQAVMKLFINHSVLDQKIVNELNTQDGFLPATKLPNRLKRVVTDNSAVYRG